MASSDGSGGTGIPGVNYATPTAYTGSLTTRQTLQDPRYRTVGPPGIGSTEPATLNGKGGTPGTTPTPLTQQQQDAYDYLVNLLKSWGLQQLAPDVLKLVQQGHDQSNIPALLQDTAAYKQRFAGNQIRIKNGLAALSPAEYLAAERSYRQILSSNGLPAGFYDSPSDFAGWIGKDVSPSEINTRVNYAVQAANRVDAGTKQAFQQYYGVDTSHLAAYFLDQSRAMPLLEKQSRAAAIGAAGFNNGLSFSRGEAEALSQSQLVQPGQYDQAVGEVAGMAREGGFLAGLYHDTYNPDLAAQEVFYGDQAAKKKRQDLTGKEQAQFSGNGGAVAKTSLSATGANSY